MFVNKFSVQISLLIVNFTCIIVQVVAGNSSELLQSKIQGSWICEKVTNHSGDLVGGDFGEPEGYLKFTFERNRLFVSLAPFDKGFKYWVSYDDTSFTIYLEDKTRWKYEVAFINNQGIILTTTSISGSVIQYWLVNAKQYVPDPEYDTALRYYALAIVINEANPKYNGLGTFTKYFNPFLPVTATYLITRSANSYLPCTMFNPPSPLNFALFMANNFQPRFAIGIDSLNAEMIMEFDVSNNGIEALSIIKSNSYELSSHVYKILITSSKYWKSYHPNVRRTRIRMSFLIVRGI